VNAQPKHLKQIEALEDPTRFKFWLAGRRGGKTIGIREDILSHVPSLPDKVGILYVGPTNQDAKDIIWNELQDRLDELGWKYKPKVQPQRFELSRGRYIQIIGAEKIRRVRGKKYKRVYLDEIAFYSKPLKEIWRAVRPCLTDVRGGAIAATTPNGKGTDAYDFYLNILNKEDWSYHYWTTLDNPFIDPNEVEAARRELDPKSFNQEYCAGWESFEGLAYYCFDENTHIKKCSEIDLKLPVELVFDFNVNPTTLLVSQQRPGGISFRREYSQKNSGTPATVRSFCEDMKAHQDKIQLHIYGDASGSSRRSNTGRSDYDAVKDVLTHYGYREKESFHMRVMAANPAIIDRVSYANAWLKNAAGESRVEIDPSCVDLIRDLSSQPLEGRFPSDKNNLGHKADAFGYRIHWAQTIGQRKPQGTVQF
jgi:hypothetical protein